VADDSNVRRATATTLVELSRRHPERQRNPPIDPGEPVPDDAGELLPDTPDELPAAPIEPLPDDGEEGGVREPA
jgi:hypothetical protein